MPDITMCKNDKCEQRQNCYRYRAKPTPVRQSYFAEDVREKDGSCENFETIEGWGIDPHEKRV